MLHLPSGLGNVSLGFVILYLYLVPFLAEMLLNLILGDISGVAFGSVFLLHPSLFYPHHPFLESHWGPLHHHVRAARGGRFGVLGSGPCTSCNELPPYLLSVNSGTPVMQCLIA